MARETSASRLTPRNTIPPLQTSNNANVSAVNTSTPATHNRTHISHTSYSNNTNMNTGASSGCAEDETIAYWGSEGCYSERAAKSFMHANLKPGTQSWETRSFMLLDRLMEAVSTGECSLAVLPIENSITGTFHQVLDLLTKHEVNIVGETIAHDDACLMALPGVELKDIRNVLSHSSVLERCETFLRKEVQAALTATTDTAGAALHIKLRELRDTAAVASESVARLHNLNILAKDIDTGDCATRYVFISKEKKCTLISGMCNKTSVIISLRNRPGALFKALACFALRDINVVKFESRPSNRAGALYEITRPWEYVAYVDIDGSSGEDKIKCAIDNLNELAQNVRVLGSYPVFQPAHPTASGQRSI
ncbi:hypothetical protein SARC_06144 [Sphaeroforma arctica JP610]|uniref:Prephenate dehydratase n=1 Tax=Sphaeroforma arctica JP610 TaxID=667725 RepID=A0A0L0FXI0_9EUKA|nr:hypothetical protein SARC_06144 [Sphaeroforma arctica JP610]KNC81537.1 hypothetical protein SARC_06144 [Sphaeroforma arctica JP610]|eukprot:XP_014155439.1 hypothetical protein SARC_06144 [Sphaeroforma arctica JP610]